MVATTTPFQTISVAELAKECQSGRPVNLIDVRTPVEFRELHSVYARNVPLDELASLPLEKVIGPKSDPVYVICRSGNRSTKACELLVREGFTRVVNLDGGTLAWEAAGLPVERGKKAISLERQVRIAAGTLVLVGAVLGAFVHPYWIGLSAFVGAGLIFAGVTDTCGMAMVLARMPWNKIRDASKDPAPKRSGPSCCSA